MASTERWLHIGDMMSSDDTEMKIANIPPFGLRMQPELKRRVEAAAKANGRSLNSEIVSRLERSFSAEGELSGRMAWIKRAKESAPPNSEIDELVGVIEERLDGRIDAVEAELAELKKLLGKSV